MPVSETAVRRLGPKGLVWHTRRLSWDGFDQLRIVDGQLRGLAWAAFEWREFRVELSTGNQPEEATVDDDAQCWEILA